MCHQQPAFLGWCSSMHALYKFCICAFHYYITLTCSQGVPKSVAAQKSCTHALGRDWQQTALFASGVLARTE